MSDDEQSRGMAALSILPRCLMIRHHQITVRSTKNVSLYLFILDDVFLYVVYLVCCRH